MTYQQPNNDSQAKSRLFRAAEMLEANRIKDMREGKDVSEYPDFVAVGIPSCTYAITVLAPYNDVISLSETSHFSDNRYHATMQVKHNNATRVGAGSHADEFTAKCFAFRNAIRQILPAEKCVSIRQKSSGYSRLDMARAALARDRN